ncbi:MAG: MMPL family transporter [Dehalococcoidia bacterium]|nr:MMPL family transporter [Dehalococcoidia bacterium]
MIDKEQYFLENYGLDKGGDAVKAQSIADLFIGFFGALPPNAQAAETQLKMVPDRLWMNFVSKDFTQAHIALMHQSPESEPTREFFKSADLSFVDLPPGVTVTTTGAGLLTPRLADDLAASRTKLTYIGLGFIFAMLMLLFRFNIRRVIVAGLPVLIVLGLSTAFMKILDLPVTTVMAMIPAQMMGIGVEFTILLLMRYYEERDRGEDPMAAMITAMSRIGRAIIISGMVVIVGFGSLMFVDFPFMHNFGIITVIDMALVLVCTLVLLPAIVVSFDKWEERKTKVAELAK